MITTPAYLVGVFLLVSLRVIFAKDSEAVCAYGTLPGHWVDAPLPERFEENDKVRCEVTRH